MIKKNNSNSSRKFAHEVRNPSLATGPVNLVLKSLIVPLRNERYHRSDEQSILYCTTVRFHTTMQ